MPLWMLVAALACAPSVVNPEDTGEAWVSPYAGGYSAARCEEDPVPTGPSGLISGMFQPDDGPAAYYEWPVYEVGDVVDDWSWPDQHGEAVRLYDFCAQHVMLVFGAFW